MSATTLSLPPPPSLECRHLRLEAAETPLGTLEAFVPASEEYVCRDPHAPVLLLVPGLGLDGLGFIRQLPLGAVASLYLFQNPNAPVAGEADLNAFARYVEEYILAKKLDQRPGGLFLGGASMGGAITQLVALRGRVKLRGLVLLGTFGSCKHLPYFQRLAAPLAYVIPMAFLRRCAWMLAGKTGLRSISIDEAKWMSHPQVKRTQGYYGRAVGGLARLEVSGQICALSLPALILHGTQDNVLPFAAAEELHGCLKNSKLVKVDGARHSLFFTHHEQVNAAVAEFVRDTVAAAAQNYHS